MIGAVFRWWLALPLAVVAFPLVWLQGRRLRNEIPRSGPAACPADGVAGSGEPGGVSVIGLGDSVIAGVGIERLELTVTAAFAGALAARRGSPVAWHARGVDGDRLADVVARVPLLPRAAPTYVVVSVGVNDVTGFTSLLKWQSGLLELTTALRERFPAAIPIFLGLPPLASFPCIPRPLSWVLGARAALLDSVMARTAKLLGNTRWLDMRGMFDPSLLASDGFHPGASAHTRMGEALVELVEDVGASA